MYYLLTFICGLICFPLLNLIGSIIEVRKTQHKQRINEIRQSMAQSKNEPQTRKIGFVTDEFFNNDTSKS